MKSDPYQRTNELKKVLLFKSNLLDKRLDLVIKYNCALVICGLLKITKILTIKESHF